MADHQSGSAETFEDARATLEAAWAATNAAGREDYPMSHFRIEQRSGMTTKRKWTPNEEEKLVAMAKNGLGRRAIAEALNRSIASVQLKAFWLKISVAEPSELAMRQKNSRSEQPNGRRP